MMENGKIKYGRVGGFKTPEEAEKSYYNYKKELENQRIKYIVPIIDKEIMFKEYLIYWFENIYALKVESTTKMISSYCIYELIIPNIQYNMKLRLITPEYLNELLEKISKIGKTSANKGREILSIAFKNAIIDKYITVNPMLDTNHHRRQKPKVKVLNMEELKKILKATCDGNWYLEILLALFCGLRKGEILGLKFSDFNIENKTVKITRQLSKNIV